MKKTFLFILMMIGLSSLATAQKKVSFKADANIGFSNVDAKWGSTGYDSDMKAGYRITLGMEIPVGTYGSTQVYFSPGLSILSRGFRMDFKDLSGNSSSMTASPHYAQLPLQVGARWKFGDRMGVSVQVGPYLEYGLFGDIDIDIHAKGVNLQLKPDYFGEPGFKRFDVGGIVQAAFEYSRFYFQLGTDFGFLNTSNNKKYLEGMDHEHDRSVENTSFTFSKLRNRSFFMGVGIHF